MSKPAASAEKPTQEKAAQPPRRRLGLRFSLRTLLVVITDAGYRQLQAALPDCQIQADVPAAQQRHQHLFWGRIPSL